MNLIEKLGLEKCKQIVDGASFGTHYQVDTGKVICCHNENHFYFVDQVKLGVEFIRIDDLRAALADHDRTDYVSDIRNHISPTTVVIER